MTLDSRGYVSIAELIVYVPAILLAGIICFRHGIKKTSGWIYTLLICLARIVGAICQLLTYSNHSPDLLKATLIIDSIGLSPLLLATLGLLSRLVDWINAERGSFLTVVHFRLVQLLITVGLILGIVGGVNAGSSSATGTVQPPATSQAGIILYIVAFVALVGILLLSIGSIRYVPSKERRISIAVAIALPLILVRLVYSAVSVFAHSQTFSVVKGEVGVFVGMAVVEEFLVVIMYIGLGFTLPKLAHGQQGDLGSGQWRQDGQLPTKLPLLRGTSQA